MIFGGVDSYYFLWGYVPKTTLAIKWTLSSDGNFYGIDRGIGEDVYESNVLFRLTESEIDGLETFLSNNKYDFEINCGQGEEIFGIDVDYSSALTVTVTKYGDIERVSKNLYSFPISFRCFSPTFLSVSQNLTGLTLNGWNYSGFTEYDISRYFAYDTTQLSIKTSVDSGYFEGSFLQTIDQAKSIRRYLCSGIRSNTIVFPSLGGITNPFGQRAGAGPFNCKIISWEDLPRSNLIDHEFKIKFSRVQ